MMKTSGAGAVMASRREPPHSLDFFPTPPWSTRALFERVFKHIGVNLPVNEAYDPACGQGHMAEVFREFCTFTIASDIFDYGYGMSDIDYLDSAAAERLTRADWHIFNPPFKIGEQFVLTALQRARVGVAALCRTSWLEGADRYTKLFRPYPPTLFAPFVERVPMVKGRWDPDASTATSYAWLVWQKGEFFGRLPTRTDTFWIPPGCKEKLTKADDRARFAAWSLQPDDPDEIEAIARELCADDGQDAGREITAVAYDTLTYRERRQKSTADLGKHARVPQWLARRREADDVVARFATVQALKVEQAA